MPFSESPTCSRRDFALFALYGALSLALPRRLPAEGQAPSRRDFEISFDSQLEQLASAASTESGLRRDQADRRAEAAALPKDQFFTRALPSSRQISKRASALIISSEVSGIAQYEHRFRRPTWPGGSSGVTIGIGYDLGFVGQRQFSADWTDYLDSGVCRELSECCGLYGEPARIALLNVSRIDIPWPLANRQYEERIQPQRIGETEAVLQNSDLLSADSLGALVSLVYNRGAAGFLIPPAKDPAGRFREMRNIRELMQAKRFSEIPAQLLAMQRLWQRTPGGEGLVLRRKLEAQLFSLGLSA
jgi:GH24 family phage-related lysozyme (muramidase)